MFLIYHIGTLYLIAFPFLWKHLRETNQYSVKSGNEEQIPLSVLFSKVRFTFGFLTEHNILMSLQFIATTIAIHINSYGYSAVQVAIAMSATALSFAISAPLIYFLSGIIDKRGLIFIGLGLLALSVLMIGGTEYVPMFYDDP